MARRALISGTALPLCCAGLLVVAPAGAQSFVPPPEVPAAPAAVDPPAAGLGADEIGFSADQLEYTDTPGGSGGDTGVITASGDVRLRRQGNRLRADRVIWDRTTGAIVAEGNVQVTSENGERAYGDRVELTEALRDGMVDNMLLVLADGGRLAARTARRDGAVTVLQDAAYTPCAVVDSDGCPKHPVWQITAVRVTVDGDRHRISYRDARLRILGVPVLWLPGLSHPDGSEGGGGGSGLLVPDIGYSGRNGVELSVPYYLELSESSDLTLTPHVYSKVLPALDARYRQLTATGGFQARTFVTYGSRLPASLMYGLEPLSVESRKDLRGYLEGSGRFQLDPLWSVSGSVRRTTDKTTLRRYDISNDDRLRSTFNVERIDADSYLSIAGWAVQSLRINADDGQQPIALPVIDYRLRLADPVLGGQVQLQANSLALTRTEGQDTQRAFAAARWDMTALTPMGQQAIFTAYARGDVYHTDDVGRTSVEAYRGRDGWSSRGIAALAAELRWPLVGEMMGGTQRLTPRVQVVASPGTPNLRLPNEDARAVDLEDSNLFALNRFAGYDRWEDGTRATYGADWAFDLPRLSIRASAGQSYRLSSKAAIFPVGTGLSSRWSDVVGRTTVRYANFVALNHRYRLDKDNLRFRRNELDLTVGSATTYATVGYLRLNRDIDPTLEDLRDREEIRLGGRIKLARRWSVYGSTVVDLTDSEEDPLSPSDGYAPVRDRFGVQYEDECLELGVTLRRDYADAGDASRGRTVLLRLALKNLGR